MRVALIVLSLAITAAAQGVPRRWLRANFHGHARAGHVEDDGTETPEELHRAVRAAGFAFSLHSPHCNSDLGEQAQAHYLAERAEEAQLSIPGLTIAVGEELTVADGPHYAKRTTVLGRAAPGNLNHVTILGNRTLIPFHTPLRTACERVHKEGGVCLVNHPGPGPMMWEEGLWESPQNRSRIDGLEVYNGQALSAVGIEFESRYREATSYRGLGIKIAAITGADTHGPKSVAYVKAKLAGFAGPAAKLLQLMLPASANPRPELDAATLVLADGNSLSDVVEAIKARRTVATFALPDLAIVCDGVGEVRHSADVKLFLKLSRKFAEVTLYREGEPVQTWHNADTVQWSEKVIRPAAYIFGARDGSARLLTSAIWYEPTSKSR
jgi:hypothetical protein